MGPLEEKSLLLMHEPSLQIKLTTISLLNEHSIKLPPKWVPLCPYIRADWNLIIEVSLCVLCLIQKLLTVQSAKKSMSGLSNYKHIITIPTCLSFRDPFWKGGWKYHRNQRLRNSGVKQYLLDMPGLLYLCTHELTVAVVACTISAYTNTINTIAQSMNLHQLLA